MVQLYIKHTDNNFYLLDIDPDENINLKLTVRDLNDLTKIFSPFTQSFNIKATDKNKILCGFVGNEKIQRVNNTGEFDAMIYISGFLFQSGILTFDESDYEKQDQKSFKTNFSSNLTSLSEKLGDTTIQDLFDLADPKLNITWNKLTFANTMKSISKVTLANGIDFKYGTPFVSNKRVWTYDETNLSTVDNIAFKLSRTPDTVNQIEFTEVRPAVNYMAIMEHLLFKIGVPVTCPLFSEPQLKDLFVWCNSENLIVPDASAFPLMSYQPITMLNYLRYRDSNAVALPNNPKWQITGGGASGVFKIKRNTDFGEPGGWSDGFDVSLTFNGLTSLDASGTKIKVILKNATTNVIIDSQEITNDIYSFRIIDQRDGTGMLDGAGELYIKFEIYPITLLSWSTIEFKVIEKFNYTRKVSWINRTAKSYYSFTAINNTLSSSLGGNVINLVTVLPKMKCIDFLSSFFKTFNIMVVSTGLNDQSMYWLTHDNLKETNKPYSKRIVDYTPYTDVSSFTKKKGNQYNQYLFSHFASKYYDSKYGDGTYFGSLTYPPIAPAKPTKFEVKTGYSILKQAYTFVHPSTAKTCLAFENDAPTVLDNGGNRYKPVFEEFTLFYLQQKDLGINFLSIESTPTQNAKLTGILEASFKCSNGKTLSFGADALGNDSLYLNYYDDFIELLLSPNTYKTEFNLNLPANEIFLNFANLNQNENNIPTGFRAQNEIIIGEQRYYLLDSQIDLTTGKSKLTLLNF